MEGYHLNKKHWNTVILSGQLDDDEIHALILHSYQLVSGTSNQLPDVDV
jgi:predicted DNA-binding protein (MmcQ/YjbR family)